ncbi:MAG: C40 family peptidase [Bacteroidales bacterium]|jgi:hypothetical protein|nr:C40 family peptidase [Bacteroidales bacterium]
MKHGFCNLAIVPIRRDFSHSSEMVSQLLFGDVFSILDERDSWFLIENYEDKYIGWVEKKQVILIKEEEYVWYNSSSKLFTKDAIAYIFQTNLKTKEKIIYPIYFGSQIINQKFQLNNILFEISPASLQLTAKSGAISLMAIAIKYLSTPYLWGGKSIFGIDCSGFTQICFKQVGITLLRDAKDQALQGETINSIDYAAKGDLCFFENEDKKIIHVGIYMGENKIIHSSGQVRIDYINEKGIFQNKEKQTHILSSIKRVL